MSDTYVPTREDLAFEDPRTRMRGELIQPGDKGYGELRKVYDGGHDASPRVFNGMSEKLPATRSREFVRRQRGV